MQVHHEVKSYDSQFKIYQEVTAFGAVLDDPRTAAAQIRKAIEVALKFKRPVYLEVPRDMVFAEISPLSSVEQVDLRVDEGAVMEAAQEIVSRLTAAKSPVLIVGVEVHRFHLTQKVLLLAERLQIPVTSSFLGRGVLPTRHPQFIGTYLGGVSPQPLREIVESSDCLLLLGELVSDTSLGVSADRINEDNLIVCTAREVFIKYHQFQYTPLDMVVDRLLTSDLPVKGQIVEAMGTDLSAEIFDPFKQDEQIRMKHLIKLVNEFLEQHPEFPLVADTGDALFASGRRPLVLVGDGAFQMTGSEISHARRYKCNPIVVVLNNSQWEMLQAFFPEARYNETGGWPFSKLADLWGGRGFRAHTPRQFRDALDASFGEDKRFSLIEVGLQPGDISPILRGFVNAVKNRVHAT
ncbi:MAG: hypothetical protein EXQ55_00255 [Acidobacteria bacterium]|nr:hypothetical protein [Acidobacteriota bacterium]